MVLKSSVALNNSGRIIAMKYGFSQGKASYPWVEKWFDRATPQVAFQSNTLHIFPPRYLCMNFPERHPKTSFKCPTSDPGTLWVMSHKTSFWKPLSRLYKLYRFITLTHLLNKMHKLIVALGKTSSSLTALRGIHRFFPDPPQDFSFCTVIRCWSSPVIGCGGVTQCANLPCN